jgi:heat shock protein HslJ
MVFAGAIAGCGDGEEPASAGDASAGRPPAPAGARPAAPAESTSDHEELVGVLWEATGFLDAASIEAPLEPGSIQFTPNGFVSGSDGCNGFGYVESDGEPSPSDGLLYEIEGDEITFSGDRLSTAIGCADTRYVERIEQVLAGTVTYALEGETLTLTASNGSSGVVFIARPGA